MVDKSDEERKSVAQVVSAIVDGSLRRVIETLAEKEGRKGDKKTIENLMQIYGRDTRLLAFRILDELLLKE